MQGQRGGGGGGNYPAPGFVTYLKFAVSGTRGIPGGEEAFDCVNVKNSSLIR